jgi:hypothetical protein
MTQRFKVFFD